MFRSSRRRFTRECFEDLLRRRRPCLACLEGLPSLLDLQREIVAPMLDDPPVQNLHQGRLLVERELISCFQDVTETHGRNLTRGGGNSAQPRHVLPDADRVADPRNERKGAKIMAKATFGAGCFWGVEAAFRQIKGVKATLAGYAGGTMKNPTYEDVCSSRTGHAEVVEVEYDPAVVAYYDLLRVFWENHNPTTLNRQGPDIGSQYRSAIFFHDPEQEAAARRSKDELGKSGRFKRPIVTQIEPAQDFWRAEEYHQQYLEKRGLASCHI
jgi:peptide-methionine (S)-S-oxide reductase